MPFGVSWGRGQEGGVLLEAPETQIQYKGSQPTQTSGIQCKACLCCPHLCQALGSQVGKPGLRLVVAVRQARAGLLCCCLGLDTHSQPTALLIPAANNVTATCKILDLQESAVRQVPVTARGPWVKTWVGPRAAGRSRPACSQGNRALGQRFRKTTGAQ